MRLEFALALAQEAGSLAQRMRADLGAITSKDPIDFCTEADRAVETCPAARGGIVR